MTTINNLSIEQMREIVGRHECLGTHFSEFKYFSKKYDDFFTAQWLNKIDDFVSVDDLRTAIAKHDTTDHVTDIRNHVSPSTIVKDLEAERHG